MDKRSIGVFDSGVGGLTVLKEIIKLLPNEDIIYLGDTRRMPYGSKSKESIIEYTRQCVKFLLNKNVKAIVVACGTASSQALDKIEMDSKIPIIGIIKPTANSLSAEGYVGVIATRGTINSGVWEREIKRENPNKEVISIACPLLAPMAEEGWTNNEVARLTIKEYLKPFKNSKISSLVLGCTHYPLFYDLIKNEIGESTEIIDTGIETSKYLKEILTKNNLLNEIRGHTSCYEDESSREECPHASHKIYLTDVGGNFLEIANDLLNGIIEVSECMIEKVELM